MSKSETAINHFDSTALFDPAQSVELIERSLFRELHL
jgi:hypothetical protein